MVGGAVTSRRPWTPARCPRTTCRRRSIPDRATDPSRTTVVTCAWAYLVDEDVIVLDHRRVVCVAVTGCASRTTSLMAPARSMRPVAIIPVVADPFEIGEQVTRQQHRERSCVDGGDDRGQEFARANGSSAATGSSSNGTSGPCPAPAQRDLRPHPPRQRIDHAFREMLRLRGRRERCRRSTAVHLPAEARWSLTVQRRYSGTPVRRSRPRRKSTSSVGGRPATTPPLSWRSEPAKMTQQRRLTGTVRFDQCGNRSRRTLTSTARSAHVYP